MIPSGVNLTETQTKNHINDNQKLLHDNYLLYIPVSVIVLVDL
jgi:hypothetical protein